jgi:hypothetical protein
MALKLTDLQSQMHTSFITINLLVTLLHNKMLKRKLDKLKLLVKLLLMHGEMDLLQVQLLLLKCKDKVSQIAILNIMVSFQPISKLPTLLLRQQDKLPLMLKKLLTHGDQDLLLPQQLLLNKNTQFSLILLAMIKKLTPGLINKLMSATKLPIKVTLLQIILLNQPLMLISLVVLPLCKNQEYQIPILKSMESFLLILNLLTTLLKLKDKLMLMLKRKLTNGETDSLHLQQPLLNKDTQSSPTLLPMIKLLTPGLINKPMSVMKLPIKVTPLQIILLNHTLMLSLRVQDL